MVYLFVGVNEMVVGSDSVVKAGIVVNLGMGFHWESYHAVKSLTKREVLEDPLRINVLMSFMDEWVEEEKYETMMAIFDAVEEFMGDYTPVDESADLIHPLHPDMSVIFPY